MVKFASVCFGMEKMLIISNDFSSEASGPVLLKFSLGKENERLLKLAWSIDQNGCHAHIIMVKTFKNLLQNQISPRP